jgi:hypothetical protein
MTTTQIVLYALLALISLFALLTTDKGLQRASITCLLGMGVAIFVLSSATARVAIDAIDNPSFRQGVSHLANKERHFFIMNLFVCITFWFYIIFKKK